MEVRSLDEILAIILPVRGGLDHRLIEPGQEGSRIDGLHLDLEWLQFYLKRLGDALQGLLARGIGCHTRSRREHRCKRTSKHDLTGPFVVDPLADELLSEFQGREKVDLKRLADEIDRNFRDWTKFADSSVAEKNINVPSQRVVHVVGLKEV